MKFADTLSRAYTPDGQNKMEIGEPDMTHYVHPIIHQLPISDSKLQCLQSETASYPTSGANPVWCN